MNQVEKIYSENSDPKNFSIGYMNYLKELLSQIDPLAIAGFIETLIEARNRGAQIFFIGNGGSAATASHFANDLAIGTKTLDKPFRVTSLTDNLATITAIANDSGYEEIFLQQLKVLFRPGDVVVGISASGNSPNILKAIEYTNQEGGFTVGLTGFEGGKLRKIVKLNIHVPTQKGEYGPVEDVHMMLDHLTSAYLMYHCQSLHRTSRQSIQHPLDLVFNSVQSPT